MKISEIFKKEATPGAAIGAAMNIYTIFDRETGLHSIPFFQPTDTHALRIFKHEANNANSNVHQYANVHFLFRIGAYDDRTGNITSNVEQLARASDLINKGEA